MFSNVYDDTARADAYAEVEVRPDDYAEDLIRRTNGVLSAAVLELAPRIRDGNLPRTPQDPTGATFYPKRTPADGLIDWTQPTDSIYRLVRAAGRPYPGAFSFIGAEKLIVWRARPAGAGQLTPEQIAASPGTVLRLDNHHSSLIRTGDGGLWLTETQSPPSDGTTAGPGTLPIGSRLGTSM